MKINKYKNRIKEFSVTVEQKIIDNVIINKDWFENI